MCLSHAINEGYWGYHSQAGKKQQAIPEWIIGITTPQSTRDVLSITKAA
jgi:hypothetical protein